MPDRNQILIGTAIGILGALAFGIKLIEGLNALLRASEEDGPVVIDTQTNGGL